MIEIIKIIKKKFLVDTGLKATILKNFLWLFAGNASSHLLRALIVIYAARKLGVVGYGVFSYALGLAGFFVFFKNIGVDCILTREVAKQPEKTNYYFSTAFWIEIILLVITTFLVIFVAPFFSGVKDAIPLLPFVALILIFDDLKDLFVAFFRGKEKMELEALVAVIANIALVLFGFTALFFWTNPISFTISNAAASFVGVIAAAFLLKSFIKGIVKNFSKNLVTPILKSAWPFAIGGVIGIFLFNIDIVMLGWWRTPAEIGLYSAAQRIIGMLAIFSGFVATATLPTLSRLAYSNRQKMGDLLENSLKAIFIVAIPLVIGGFLLSNSLVEFLFGKNYLPAAGVFTTLLFSVLAVHPLAIISNLLFVFDQQIKTIEYAAVSALSNFVLNCLLIPKYGMEGSAIATTISFFIYIFLIWRTGKKIYDFKIFFGLIKSLIAASIMGILVYVLKMAEIHILINIVVSGAFYFFILYLFKEKIIKEVFSFLRFSALKND